MSVGEFETADAVETVDIDTGIEANERRPINRERRREITGFIAEVLSIAKRVLAERGIENHPLENFDESREYQIGALDAIWNAIDTGIDSGMLHLATGLGKTSVAVFAFAKFVADRLSNCKQIKGLFLVHQRNIRDQAMGRFALMMPHTKIAKLGSKGVDPAVDLTFATFQSMTGKTDQIPADTFDYIIVDEAHHAKAETYDKVIEHFKPTFKLALTATPEREDGKQIEDHFGKALYSVPLEEALARRYLAAVRYTPMYDDAVVELVESGFKPEKLGELRQLLEVEMRNEEIARKIKEKQQQICEEEGLDECKTIIFCADLDHADNMADLTGGVSYHSKKNPKEQDDILEKFRTGEHNTITVKDMFNEGVDIPDARLIVMIRSTGSKRILEQQLGRGLRRTATKKVVDVMDFVAGIERVDMIYSMKKRIDDWIEKIKQEQAEDDWDESESSSGGISAKPVNPFASEFVFTERTVEFLEHFHYLLEQEKPIDWNAYTNEQLVTLALEISPDKPLTISEIRRLCGERRFPSTTVITRRFGSVVEFQRACGFEIKDWDKVGNCKLVKLALEFSPDKPLSNSMIEKLNADGEFPSSYIIRERFGSVVEFQRACGFDIKDDVDWGEYTNDDLVTLALELSPDRPLLTRMIKELSKDRKFPCLSTIVNRFGSIAEFHKACGFEVVEVNEYVDWNKVGNCKLVKLALELSPGKQLGQEMINKLSKERLFPSFNTIKKRFGSLVAFQRACGFEIKDWDKVGNCKLIKLALELSPDKPLSQKMVNKLSKENQFPSTTTIEKRFGSLTNFQKLVELQKLQLALGQVLAKSQD